MKIWQIKILIIILIIIGGISSFKLILFNPAEANDLIPTSVEVLVACGDGFTVAPEVCDPGNPPDLPPDVGTTTCANFNDIFGDPFASGDLGCLSDCSYFSTSTCYSCGNGTKEPAEECEGSDFGGNTCETYGLISGNLTCPDNCKISLVECLSENPEYPGTPGGGSSGGSAGGTTGYIPGSEQERVTKVVISGMSYPNSEVHILLDGKVVGIAAAAAKADFYFETTEITPGVASFGFWSEDKEGLRSTLLSLTVRIISGAVTTISGVYLSPSINTNKKAVDKGEPILIFGQTAPDTNVYVHVNSEEEIVESTDSEEDGDWSIIFDTNQVEEDYHTAKALFQMEVEGNIIKSGFSRSVSFYVGKDFLDEDCPGADLNKDGRVNLTDFSILLYWWGTDNACADQDDDGNVNLIDFSIMMYHWTG